MSVWVWVYEYEYGYGYIHNDTCKKWNNMRDKKIHTNNEIHAQLTKWNKQKGKMLDVKQKKRKHKRKKLSEGLDQRRKKKVLVRIQDNF